MDVLCLPNEENPSSPTLDRPRPHRCSHVRELRLEDVTAPHMLPLVETLCRDSDGRTPAPRLLQLSDRLSCATHLTHHSVVHLLSAIDPLDGEGPLSLVVGSPFDNIVEAGISSALNSLPGGVRELRSLDVADAPWAGDRFLQAVLRHCPHLETLDVGRLLHYGDAKTVTGLGARLLAQGAQRLRCLSLAGLPETSVNASTLSALLVALGGCLTSLCIARCPGVDDAACEAIRDHSLALVDLDMTGCVGVSGRGWTNMLRGASPDGVKGPLIGRLRELSIARCALRDAEVAVLVEGAAALRLLDVTQGSEQPEDDRGHDLGSVLADGLIAGCRNLEFLIMDGRCKETVGVAQVVVALCLGLKKLKLVYHGIALDEREIVAGYRARVPLEEGSGISSINSFSEHWKRDLTQEASKSFAQYM
ncbi:hypothetical protein HK101_008461 [Irineochytrium annulatum]|nr:hypothetical protein HK101_008461 [Irineochytrium annulatum]